MPTTEHWYVDPNATGDGNGTSYTHAYTTLNAAEQAKDDNIVTADKVIIFHCRALNGTADQTAVLVSDWITDPTRYVQIETETTEATGRHHGVWSDTHYRLEVTDAGPLSIYEDYVRVEGLQLKTVIGASPGNGKHNIYINLITATNNDLRIGNCLIVGHESGTYTQSGIQVDTANAILTVWNTIMYGFATIANTRPFAAGGVVNIYSCTLIGGSYGIRSSGTVAVKNTYIGGAGTECFYRNSGTLAKTTCASSDSSADDTSGTDETVSGTCLVDVLVSTTADSTHAGFENVLSGTENYHIKTGSPLIGGGTTLSDDPPGSTALGLDIDGETRSAPWDIGADEWIQVPDNVIPAMIWFRNAADTGP